jgi:hypothetical protein
MQTSETGYGVQPCKYTGWQDAVKQPEKDPATFC